MNSKITFGAWKTTVSLIDSSPMSATSPIHCRPYPSLTTQDKVVEWFMDYQQQLESSSSGERVLYHEKTKRKVDLFAYPNESQQFSASDSPYDWGKVVVLGELKYRKRGQEIGNNNPELVIQLANYVREAFAVGTIAGPIGVRIPNEMITAAVDFWCFNCAVHYLKVPDILYVKHTPQVLLANNWAESITGKDYLHIVLYGNHPRNTEFPTLHCHNELIWFKYHQEAMK
ncbi:hypothetical protein K440DRAFT_609057 [Wilcoxina mikolae CBS 423.85]|nr:hypothetical protein K440DRAFT_609057 [Wilcoxina mikolae CBS 423.85]